jgi:hypothetical protein
LIKKILIRGLDNNIKTKKQEKKKKRRRRRRGDEVGE